MGRRRKTTAPIKKPKTWAEKWGERDIWEEYQTMGTSEKAAKMADDLRKVRQATSRRLSTLKKHGSVSYAEYALKRELKKSFINGKPDFKKIEANPRQYYDSLEKLTSIFHNFWEAKTSSVKGAYLEQQAQGRRIYGVEDGEDKLTGKPVRVMDYKESSLYWALYDEFYAQKNEASRVYSGIVQFDLGEILTQEDKNKVTLFDKLLPSFDPDVGLASLDLDVSDFIEDMFSRYKTNVEKVNASELKKPLFRMEAEK